MHNVHARAAAAPSRYINIINTHIVIIFVWISTLFLCVGKQAYPGGTYTTVVVPLALTVESPVNRRTAGCSPPHPAVHHLKSRIIEMPTYAEFGAEIIVDRSERVINDSSKGTESEPP
jgi:hypothetical protein